MRAVKAYFLLDAEQSIAAAIFAEGLDTENCLPTEYSGYAAVTIAAAHADEAKDSLPTKNFVELRSHDVGTTAGERGLIPGKVQT